MLLAGLLLAGAGCEQPPTPTRTWQPSDHGVPPQLADDGRQAAPRAAEAPRLPSNHPPVADPRKRPDVAATLWRVSCAECHGAGGRGDGPKAPGPMPDLTDPAWQRRTTDAQVRERIEQGSPRGMPAFGERLAPAAIEALVGYVRRLSATHTARDAAGATGAARQQANAGTEVPERPRATPSARAAERQPAAPSQRPDGGAARPARATD